MCIFSDVADLLLKHGADPNFVGTSTEVQTSLFIDYGRHDSVFPLMFAILNGALSCAELLLKSGAKINQTNAVRQTALHALCRKWYQRDGKKLIQLLLKHKVDVSIKDAYGRTALHYACERKWRYQVDLLLQAGAQMNMVDDTCLTELQVAANSDDDPDLKVPKEDQTNMLNYSGLTELQLAAQSDYDPKVLKGDQINIIDDSGLTELHLAALSDREPHLKVQQLFQSCPYSKIIVIEIYETLPFFFMKNHSQNGESTLEQAFDYMRKATLMRKEHNLPKTVSVPLACYDFAKEWETMEDLLRYKNSSRDLMVQATLSRERNYKGRYGLSSLRKSLDIYSKYRNCFISSFQGPF